MGLGSSCCFFGRFVLQISQLEVRRLSSSSCNTWYSRNRWKILESLLVEGSNQQDIQYKNNHHEFLLNILEPENFHFPRWGSSPILLWNCLMTSHSSPPHWRTCSNSCCILSPPRSESEAAMNITLSGRATLTLRARCLYFEQ